MNEKISSLGLSCLVINCVLAKLFIGFSDFLINDTGSAACLSLLLSSIIFIAILVLSYKSRNIIKSLISRPHIRNIALVIFIIYLVGHGIYYVREMTGTINQNAYPNTPTQLMMILIIATVLIIGSRNDFSIIRLHSLFVPIILIGVFAIFFSAIKYDDLYNAMPILGNGGMTIISGALKNIFAFSEILIPIFYLMLMPKDMPRSKNTSKILLYSSIAATAIYCVFFLAFFLSIPPGGTTTLNENPLFYISRFSSISRLNTRLDVLNIIISIMSGVLYLSSSLLVIRRMVKKLGLSRRLFKTTTAILIISISILPLCGCYDNMDIEDTAYAIAVGIDEDPNSNYFLFTFQFTNPLATGENIAFAEGANDDASHSQNSSVNNMQVSGKNIFDGIENLKKYIGKNPTLSHLKLIVISKSVVDQGYTKELCMDFFSIIDVRPETSICLTDSQSASDYVYQVNPSLEESTARYYGLLFSEKSTSETLQTDLRSLIIKLTGTSGDGYIPIISSNGFSGALLFSGEDPKMMLDNQECQILNIILGTKHEPIFYTSDSGIVYKIKNEKMPKIAVNINDETMYADIDLSLSDIKTQSKAERKLDLIEQELNNKLSELLSKVYKNNCDILSIGRHARAQVFYEHEWQSIINRNNIQTYTPNLNCKVVY